MHIVSRIFQNCLRFGYRPTIQSAHDFLMLNVVSRSRPITRMRNIVRILVPLKHVFDPELANKVRISDDGQGLFIASSERKINPFDEYALEAALRLTEDGRSPRTRFAEIIVVTIGNRETEVMLRSSLATGADRAIRVNSEDQDLDASMVAQVLSRLALIESCDLVVMGKQSSDGDGNEVGQRLALILAWPQATFVSKIVALDDGRLLLEREIDGGIQRLRVVPPVVMTVDLRVVTPDAVKSIHTPPDFQYAPGVRFAALPAIMQARKKPLEVRALNTLCTSSQPLMKYVRYELPATRTSGRIVSSPNELVKLLTHEAKVL